MHRIARLPLVAGLLSFLLASGLAGSVSAQVADPEWGPVQEVPPFDRLHDLPRTGIFPDGTLVAVWEDDDTGDQDDLTRIFRSTRSPGGDWSEPLPFPVEDVWNLQSITTRPDGSLQIAYGWEPRFPDIKHRVRIWNADGTVEAVGLANTSDDYTLSSDSQGDVVAERLGSYDEQKGFDHLLRYYDGETWRRLPKLPAYRQDRFLPGPGDSVWMAGYDPARSKFLVRRWAPGMAAWKVEWSRDYPSGHLRKPLVTGVRLAVSSTGRVVVAFQEREVGKTGDTVRAVTRHGRSWTRPFVLQRLPAGKHLTASLPVLAVAGDLVELAWTASAPKRPGMRVVRLARLTAEGPEVRRLAVARSRSGFRDLFLGISMRGDGDVLVTYFQRSDDHDQLMSWLGPHDGLRGTLLLDNAWSLGGGPFLVPGLAGVIAGSGSLFDQHLVSRVLEY